MLNNSLHSTAEWYEYLRQEGKVVKEYFSHVDQIYHVTILFNQKNYHFRTDHFNYYEEV